MKKYIVMGIVGVLLLTGSCTFINSNNAPATPQITASKTEVNSGEEVNLNAESSDPDGDPITYTWTATGGHFNTTSGNAVVWTAPSVEETQTYTISVEVKDDKGASSSASINITVNKDSTGGGGEGSYVTIGNDSLNLWEPFGGAAETYKKTEFLYYGTEIGKSGKIIGISTWSTSTFERTFTNFKIYLVSVNRDALEDTLSANYEGKEPVLVYQTSSLTYGVKETDWEQWHDFDFTTSYDYNQSDNLLIIIERNSEGGGGAAVGVAGFSTTGTKRVVVNTNSSSETGVPHEEAMYIRLKFE